MLKWKYGDYQFTINPNSKSTQVEMVGDDVRKLNGALVSQPTFLLEKYSVSSVFYQGRNKTISKVGLPNALCVESLANQFYVLNSVNDRLDIYNPNFNTSGSSISLSAVTAKSYVSFDIQSDFIWILSSVDATTDKITKLNPNGTLNASANIAKAITSSGIEFFNAYLWVLHTNGTISKVRPSDFAIVSTIVLPAGLSYTGLTSDNDFLIVGNNDTTPKIYHIDVVNASIVNQITFDTMTTINDIAINGVYFYTINSSAITKVQGNTVEADLYRLMNEIKTKSFVSLVDDMGISVIAYATDFTTSRRIEFEHMYEVSMTIQKLDRG